MVPHFATLETVGQDIDEAHAQIVVTRDALQASLDIPDGDISAISRAISQMVRIEAEPTGITRCIEVSERSPDIAGLVSASPRGRPVRPDRRSQDDGGLSAWRTAS